MLAKLGALLHKRLDESLLFEPQHLVHLVQADAEIHQRSQMEVVDAVSDSRVETGDEFFVRDERTVLLAMLDVVANELVRRQHVARHLHLLGSRGEGGEPPVGVQWERQVTLDNVPMRIVFGRGGPVDLGEIFPLHPSGGSDGERSRHLPTVQIVDVEDDERLATTFGVDFLVQLVMTFADKGEAALEVALDK